MKNDTQKIFFYQKIKQLICLKGYICNKTLILPYFALFCENIKKKRI